MRTELELFEMYKEEKAIVIGDFKTRTGLEDFPSFRDWKREYLEDYFRLHVAVSKKEADRIMDEAVSAADTELEAMLKREMKVDPKKDRKAKVQTVKRAPRVKKAATKAATKTSKGTGTKRTVNKAAITRDIFTSMYGTSSRKDVIAKFVEAGLTPAGASTYYQKWKKELTV